MPTVRVVKELQAQREETEDGHESDYSDEIDDADAFMNTNDEGASDVDEDETDADAASDPKSDTTLLLPSAFSHLPPTVWLDYAVFSQRTRTVGRERGLVDLANEKEKQPFLFRSNHTIICLGGALKRSGARRLLKGTTYNVFWGHHLKEPQLQKLHPQQYVNHFPGSYCLGRKDYLWKYISRQMRAHGTQYDFCAKSYILPRDREQLEKHYEDGQVYIIKPPASAEGRGIRLANRMEQMPRPGQPAVVQDYISDPHLIDGKKYDLRIYVAVTSFDPLRAYMYEEGLVRFATSDYTLTAKSIRNRFAHLTNYSVNKKSENFVRNEDASHAGEGSKWALTAYWKYMEDKFGIDVPALRKRIFDIAVKTLIAAEPNIASKVNQAGRPSCFELFGLDVLLDSKFKPWLIEVNVACSLASSSPLDRLIKHFMMTDLLHLVGIAPYDRKQTRKDVEKARESRLHNGTKPRGGGSRNIFELNDKKLQQLGPDDLDIIATAEDENARSGDWTRIFPCDDMARRYLPLFEFPRYKNTVLAKWMDKADWSLLAPMFSQHLPSEHAWRKLAAQHAAEKAERAAHGGSGAAAALRRALEAKREHDRLQREQQQQKEQREEMQSRDGERRRLMQQVDEANGDRAAVERARAALFEPLGEAMARAEGGGGQAPGADSEEGGGQPSSAAASDAPRAVGAMPALVGCSTGETSAVCAQAAPCGGDGGASADAGNAAGLLAVAGLVGGTAAAAAASGWSASNRAPVRWDEPLHAHSSHGPHGLSVGYTAAGGSVAMGGGYGAAAHYGASNGGACVGTGYGMIGSMMGGMGCNAVVGAALGGGAALNGGVASERCGGATGGLKMPPDGNSTFASRLHSLMRRSSAEGSYPAVDVDITPLGGMALTKPDTRPPAMRPGGVLGSSPRGGTR